MLICEQPVSFDDFKVLAPNNSEFHLKIKKKSVNIAWSTCFDPCHYICLISYTNILQSYDYLVLLLIHYYLIFVAFSDKIYASVSFKIVLKICWLKFVKREYGLKMCTVET